MATSALEIEHISVVPDEPAQGIRPWLAATFVAALFLLSATARPLEEGFLAGGRAAVAEKLRTVGARVEDFVPGERIKVSEPIVGGLLAGAAWVIGRRVATVMVDGSWPVAQAWFDRRTHKTDFMVWAGPDHFADGKPIGRDDTITHLNFAENGNLALAYRLSRFFVTLGIDVGQFKMSGSALRDDCPCTYHTQGGEIEVSTAGVVRQTWVSDKKGIVASVAATMDQSGQAAAGNVTTIFEGKKLERPVVFGSRYDNLQADKRLDP